MTRRKVSDIQNGLGVLDYEAVESIQAMLKDGVRPESDEEMMITEMFPDYDNPFVKELRLGLSAMQQVEQAVWQEIDRRDEDLRETCEYRKAITFLEIGAGAARYPDWQNLEGALTDYGIAENVAEVAIEDARKADDPECQEVDFGIL